MPFTILQGMQKTYAYTILYMCTANCMNIYQEVQQIAFINNIHKMHAFSDYLCSYTPYTKVGIIECNG